MMKHTGERFTCITCDKKFTTAAYLQEHIRTHTGENLFRCTMCDRTFTRPTYLEKHIRTHTGEKPFGCELCGKKFTQSSSLNVHMRKHTGENRILVLFVVGILPHLLICLYICVSTKSILACNLNFVL